MGSPRTRPTVAVGWGRNAKKQRQQIEDLATDGRDLIKEIVKAMDEGNPLIARAALGFLDANLADIQRYAVLALIGPEPADPPAPSEHHE